MANGLIDFARLHAAGPRGWTAMPRLAAWLCVPGLICSLSGLVILAISVTPLSAQPTFQAVGNAAAGVALVFWFGAFPLTPIAAALILVVSVRRKWRLDVVAWLWCAVIFSMAMLLPTMSAVMKHLMAAHASMVAGR